MLAYRRRTELLEALAVEGSLTVQQAAQRLQVSEVTIRSDLKALECQGRIKRVHGGAVLAQGQPHGDSSDGRPDQHHDALLANRAAAMVEDGESIVITAGRLSAAIARALIPRRHLTIVTNSVDVAALLCREPTNRVIIGGGMVGTAGAVTSDAPALDTIAHLTVGRAFVPTIQLSNTFGLLAESLEQAAMLRALIGLAASTIVILDGDRDGQPAPARVVPLEAIEHVVLGEHTPAPFVDALRLAGVTVSLCGNTVVTVPPIRGDQGVYRVAFANLSETEVFTKEVRRGIEEAVGQAGNIELLLADNNYDGETALRNAEQFIAQRADLVIEYQTDDSYAYRLMHRLRLARIPVIAVDIPHPGATYFGVDNYVAGRIGGEAIVREVMRRWDGGLDHIIALALPRSGHAVAARVQGQIDAIREIIPLAPELIVWLDSENVYDMAYRRACDALARIPIGARLAVVAVNDGAMRGAIAALDETGHAATAIGVSQGADRLALDELQRPGTPLIGAVAFNPETYGHGLIPLVQDILAGKEAPPAVYQHHRLIRPDEARDALHGDQRDASRQEDHLDLDLAHPLLTPLTARDWREGAE